MFDDLDVAYRFFNGIMAFTDDPNPIISTLAGPLFESNFMRNGHFGESVRNDRDHRGSPDRRPRQRFQRQQHQQRRRQRNPAGEIFCQYCPNKMPANSMAGKLH